MSIRAVFVDLGGVIVRTEFDAPRQHLADRFGMELEDIYRIIFGQESIRASVGEITEDEYWVEVVRRLRQPVSMIEAVRTEFFAGDVIDRDFLDFLRGLREKFRVGLISNAWSGLRPWIVNNKFDDAFDVMVISSEVGIMKPDPRIFQYALEQLDVAPEEAVFVDDVIENVEAARKLGMQAIQFVLRHETINKLKLLLAYPL